MVAGWNPFFFKSTGFTSSTFPIQPAAITLNTGSPRTLSHLLTPLINGRMSWPDDSTDRQREREILLVTHCNIKASKCIYVKKFAVSMQLQQCTGEIFWAQIIKMLVLSNPTGHMLPSFRFLFIDLRYVPLKRSIISLSLELQPVISQTQLYLAIGPHPWISTFVSIMWLLQGHPNASRTLSGI